MIEGLKRMLQLPLSPRLRPCRQPIVGRRATALWYDHTGRGAVEIIKCGGNNLCGKLVWLKDAKQNRKAAACRSSATSSPSPTACGTAAGSRPREGLTTKYSVELTPVGAQSLKVVGYWAPNFSAKP